MKMTCSVTKRGKSKMGVDPFAGMAQHRAEDRFAHRQARGDGAQPAQPPAVVNASVSDGAMVQPAEVKTARQTVSAKKSLRQRRMHNRQSVLQQARHADRQ